MRVKYFLLNYRVREAILLNVRAKENEYLNLKVNQ